MKEIKDILHAYDNAVKQRKRVALATVVQVEGSSYRRPGARMLITEDGQLTGAISGGCLEGDALRKALLVIKENRKMLITYDTDDEDDAKLGMGLGCNGIIQVLIEPIDHTSDNNPITLLKIATSKRQSCVLVTLFSLQNRKAHQIGTCLAITESALMQIEKTGWNDLLIADAKKAFDNKVSSFKNYISGTDSYTAFIEFIKPAISVVIAGAGNDVLPLVNMSQELGWEVTIVDGRNSYAKKERFPPGCHVLLSKPEEVIRQVSIDEQTAFVLMTHNYNYDMALLKELIAHNVIYIGLLGPKKKKDRILEELKENGANLSADRLSRIYGPVGLDIGAETSAEIALSILAEITAVLSGKDARQLREKSDSIHSRSDTSIENIEINK